MRTAAWSGCPSLARSSARTMSFFQTTRRGFTRWEKRPLPSAAGLAAAEESLSVSQTSPKSRSLPCGRERRKGRNLMERFAGKPDNLSIERNRSSGIYPFGATSRRLVSKRKNVCKKPIRGSLRVQFPPAGDTVCVADCTPPKRKETRDCVSLLFGGVGGIRTHGTVAGTPDFESGPL